MAVIPVQTIVPGALAAIIRKAPLTPEKIAFAWQTAVGAAIAGATEVVLESGCLRVRAKNDAWQREIERSAAIVRARLDDLLGKGVVRYIDVTVAAVPAEARPPAAPQAAKAPAAAARARKSPPSAGGSDTVRRRR